MKATLKSGYAADELKRDLVEKIRSGTLLPGEKILSERKLADAYRISYMTVRRAIEELAGQGYITRKAHRGVFVNEKFRNLSSARNRTIAFVAQDLYDGVVIKLLAAIEWRARRSGYFVLVCNSMLDVTIEKGVLENLLHSNVSGVILFPIAGNKNVAAARSLIAAGIPVVTIDNIYADDRIDSIDCDNFDMGYKATEHLIRNGHTNIAHITVSQENFRHNYVAQKRMEGFQQALKDHKLPCPRENIMYLPWEYTSLPLAEIDLDNLGYDQARKLLLRDNRPTAFFVMFDEIASGVYLAARNLGLCVPRDVSVIGINNIDLCRRLSPGLTTIAQPFKALGLRAVEILLMRGTPQGDRCIKEELLGTLIQRGSVANLL
ncbi:MAG: GntR family transcriptional regulator [Victivallis vadensis]